MPDKSRTSRHDRRIAAFKLLFAYEFNKEISPADFYDSYVNRDEEENSGEASEFSGAYVKEVFTGVCENLDEIDEMIENAAVKWKISRMSVPTKTILRLAVYEMINTDTPVKVVLNEAIEIIKSYDDESAPSFVNGILNKIAKNKELITPPQPENNEQ